MLLRSVKQALKRLTKWCSNRVSPRYYSNDECIIIEEKPPEMTENELNKFSLELYKLNQKFEELHNFILK